MTTSRNVSPAALLIAVLVALAVGILVSLAIRPPGAVLEDDTASQSGGFEQVRWRMTSSFTSNLPIVGPPPKRIADDLRAMSNGAFRSRPLNRARSYQRWRSPKASRKARCKQAFSGLATTRGGSPRQR